MVRLVLLLVLLAMPGRFVFAQSLTGEEVVARSLAFHDPQGQWYQRAHHIQVREARNGAEDRLTELVLDYPAGLFVMNSRRNGRLVQMRHHESGGCVGMLDGSTDISPEDLKRFRLDCEGIAWVRSYQDYLYGLPMKLRDTGVHIAPEVQRISFNGRDVLAVRVTYDATVGSDVWYFYVDPETYALVGSRFFHDEAAGDGEYLVFEGTVEAGGIILPRKRIWFTNQGDERLGTDTIEAYKEVVSGHW